MKIRTENRPYGRMNTLYELGDVFDKGSAMRWAFMSLKSLESLPLEQCYAVADDDESYHDGSESFSFKTIDFKDADVFVAQNISKHISIIRISGHYKKISITIQVSLTRYWISVSSEQGYDVILTEIEELLGLMAP